MSCADVTKVGRRDADGLVRHPHTHYARQPIEVCHRHNRGKDCPEVRNQISERIAVHLNLDEKPNWNPRNLHDVKTCVCDRGDIAKAKKSLCQQKTSRVLQN